MPIERPNYTQIPNELFDKYQQKLPPTSFSVLMAIARKTFGWHKEKDSISLSQLEGITGLSRPTIIGAIKHLEKMNIVSTIKQEKRATVFEIIVEDVETGKEILPEEDEAGKEILPEKDETGKDSLPRVVKNFNPQKKVKESFKDKDVQRVIEFWNKKGIIVHTVISPKNIRIVSGTYNLYGESIFKAIENYAAVLNGDNYYWTHKWTLWDFCQRGVEKFVDSASPLENFLRKDVPTPKACATRKSIDDIYGPRGGTT